MPRLIFTCLKNEGPYLLEWIAWHRHLGFDSFVLFTNDCDDGTDTMADRLAALGLAIHHRNAVDPDRGPQWTALRSDQLRDALGKAEWAMHLDVDEFLNIRQDQSLPGLIDTIGDAQAISIPWRFFGNADISSFTDQPIITQFRQCGPYPFMFPRQGLMFKTLFRPSNLLPRPGIHAPRPAKDAIGLKWLNGDGRQLSRYFNPERPLVAGPDAGNALAQINHYALRSRESFLVKSDRGLPNRSDIPIDLNYWVMRNFNSETDDTLARCWPKAEPEYRALLADPELGALHARACDWHKTRAGHLMKTRAGIELYAATVVTGGTRPAPRAETDTIYDGMRAVFGKPAS